MVKEIIHFCSYKGDFDISNITGTNSLSKDLALYY